MNPFVTSIRTCFGNSVVLHVISLRACCTNMTKGGRRQRPVPAPYLLFIWLPGRNPKPRAVFSGSRSCNSRIGYLRNVTQQPRVLSRGSLRAAWRMLSMAVLVPLRVLAPWVRARGRSGSVTACWRNSIEPRARVVFWGLVHTWQLPSREDVLELWAGQEG